jgi:hypothetical protein
LPFCTNFDGPVCTWARQLCCIKWIGPHQNIARGEWVDHKTGILPRTLRLAKGVEPLESVYLVKVGP